MPKKLLSPHAMIFDYSDLEALRLHHPAWRLLRSDHVALIASFLHRVFIAPNIRIVSAEKLAEQLEDTLYTLRQTHGAHLFPRPATEYLNEWAAPEKGWLRKFYRQDSDEAQFDLTPAAEKAIAWLETLAERGFVGTESRLLTLFELLRQICRGSDTNITRRIDELQKRRDEIDAEIAQILGGDLPLLDDVAIKDRFQQFTQIARALLGDFREVEHNFRMLDRKVRERIALWSGGKSALLEEIMGEHDAISGSEQGKSFRAFWDFLMSSQRQEELSHLVSQTLALPSVAELKPDHRLRRIHYDWLEAGEHTQRTIALLSQQLRRFLDDQAWLENRRIMDILHNIETHALMLRDQPPDSSIMEIDSLNASIELPMERPLYAPSIKPLIDSVISEATDEAIDTDALFSQTIVDASKLIAHIRECLQQQTQISLSELTTARPLQHGLNELIVYLQLGCSVFNAAIDEKTPETIQWTMHSADGTIQNKRVQLPRIIFME